LTALCVHFSFSKAGFNVFSYPVSFLRFCTCQLQWWCMVGSGSCELGRS